MKRLLALAIGCTTLVLAGTGASADDRVVASIKPVHALVAGVMQGVGEPDLLMTGGGSPHTYSLRPSQARALQGAGLVFWVGPDLEAFLEKPVGTLAKEATVVTLLEAPGLTTLALREGGTFEVHEDHHEEHDEDHDENHGGHDHGAVNAHVWLDPNNAAAMVGEIERALIAFDDQNAAQYRANAAVLRQELAALTEEMRLTLAPVKDRPFVVFHDAYQNLEHRFDLRAVGSITVSPEVMPGAERVAEIKAKVRELDVTCVFSEPQFEPRLVAVVTEGAGANVGVLDPLGTEIEAGPDLYFDLMRQMAASMSTCLAPRS